MVAVVVAVGWKFLRRPAGRSRGGVGYFDFVPLGTRLRPNPVGRAGFPTGGYRRLVGIASRSKENVGGYVARMSRQAENRGWVIVLPLSSRASSEEAEHLWNVSVLVSCATVINRFEGATVDRLFPFDGGSSEID